MKKNGNKNITSIVLIILLIASFTFLSPGKVNAESPSYIWVDDDFDSSTTGWGITHFDVIQHGVDAVAENGTVYVYPGTYEENVIIGKSLTLEGEDQNTTIIQGHGVFKYGYGIYSDGISDISISNFQINNFTDGIGLWHSSSSKVIENTITGLDGYGIRLYSSGSCTIVNNTIKRDWGTGIKIYNSSSCIITGNSVIGIHKPNYGIQVSFSSFSLIANNIVKDHYIYGISLWDSSSSILRENTVINNGDGGILLSTSGMSNVTGNTVGDNHGGGGIGISSSGSTIVSGNLVFNNSGSGISIRNSPLCDVNNNTAINNYGSGGISLSSSEFSRVADNNITSSSSRGIGIGGSESIQVYSNKIMVPEWGIEISDSISTIVYINMISSGGIYISNSGLSNVNNNTFDGGISIVESSEFNRVADNIFKGWVWFIRTSNVSMERNLITDGGGVETYQSDNNTIRNNIIENNSYAFYIRFSFNNSIYHNDFVDNTRYYSYSSSNTWDDGKGKGNYWSDYEGDDINDDGVGDTDLPHQGVDYYPLMKPYNQINQVIADAGGPYSNNEGSEVTLDASGSYDSLGSDLEYRWDFDNDGNWDTSYSSDPTVTHTWYDDYSGQILVEVSNGQSTDTDTAEISILNVDPIITSVTGPSESVLIGDSCIIECYFSDNGIEDTHTATINWGDGTETNPDVDESSGSGSFQGTHEYDEAGTYIVTLTVEDDDGGIVTEEYESIEVTADFVESIKNYIENLDEDVFSKNADNQKKNLLKQLNMVKSLIEDGKYEKAIKKLETNILPRVDGVTNGNSEDWISDPDAQEYLCDLIYQLIDYLESMI